MRTCRWFTLLLAGSFVWPFVGRTEVVECELATNGDSKPERTTLRLPWPYGEDSLQEPAGYNRPLTQAHRLARRLTLTNLGTAPIIQPEIIVNQRRQIDGLCPKSGFDFQRWTQVVSHGPLTVKSVRDSLKMLTGWGYTLCDGNTQAMVTFNPQELWSGRKIPLNGHVAAEHKVDGRWCVLDGDQNVAYLELSNQRYSGYDEIRADPFLALRTKPFGRYASWTLAASQLNAGLFEYIKRADSPFIAPELRGTWNPDVMMKLYPGERLTFFYDRGPARIAGLPANADATKGAPATVRAVELEVWPRARGWTANELPVALDFPTTAESGEPSYAKILAPTSPDQRLTVSMQAAGFVLPHFRAGDNELEVRSFSATRERVKVALEYEAIDLPSQPKPPTLALEDKDETRLNVGTTETKGRVWWQISPKRDFSVIAPSLEQIQSLTPSILLDPLAMTFFNPCTDYWARAKVVRQGVWSEWSEPISFRVEKPAAPQELAVVLAADGQARLTWKGEAEEYAIFGSNRLDFLPEIYAAEQIVSMKGLEVLQKRHNQNLLATVEQPAWTFQPTTRYLRVIARRGGVWSTPSALVTLPKELSAKLPLPTVFQIRWQRQDDGSDLYQGEERPLWPAAK